MAKKSRVSRISEELDLEIRNFALKNNVSFTQASQDLAKMMKKIKGNKITKEIKF